VHDHSLARLALTILCVDFLRYALAAGTIWLLVSVLFRRRLAERRTFGLYFTWWDRWCGTQDTVYLRHGDARLVEGNRSEIAS
jgi:hypothetical protein